MLQNQGVDAILKSPPADRRRADHLDPRGRAHGRKSIIRSRWTRYFFERYKTKYNLPGLTERLSMPVASMPRSWRRGRAVTRRP